MAERRIGIRELKSKLSECVREVRDGGTIVVTEHGRPVARMIADASSLMSDWRCSPTRVAFCGVAGDSNPRRRSHGYAAAGRRWRI